MPLPTPPRVIFARRCIRLGITPPAPPPPLAGSSGPATRCCEKSRPPHSAAPCGLARDKIARDVRGIPQAASRRRAAARIRSENPIFSEPFRAPRLDKGRHLCFPPPSLPSAARKGRRSFFFFSLQRGNFSLYLGISVSIVCRFRPRRTPERAERPPVRGCSLIRIANLIGRRERVPAR